MAETIVVLDAISESVAERLRQLLPPGFELTYGTALGDDHLQEIIAEADYAISGQVALTVTEACAGTSGTTVSATREAPVSGSPS